MPDSYRGTPLHSIRIDDELWAALTARAAADGASASDVIRAAVTAYLNHPAEAA